jgi:hypothetical protein
MPPADPQASTPDNPLVPAAEVEAPANAEELSGHRSKRTFWQRLGGEGLTISLIIHLILIIIAAIWVISTVTLSLIHI